MGSSVTLAVFTELGTWVGLRRANLPSPPRHLQLRRNTYICAEEDMCRHQESLTCVRKHYVPRPHPLLLLRAMRGVEPPSSRRSEACHVTCHVKFGLSCQIIPQLILTRGRLHKCATIQCGLDSSISEAH